MPVLDGPTRFKLLRAGRRWGKSRLAVRAATVGHGQGDKKGIMDGVDVVWLTPDYPTSRAIWREELKPLFGGQPGVTLNESERRVTINGKGTLELRSAENIDSIRGRKLGGLIIDEAAYLDLEYAWPNVLRPTLVDLTGWCLFNSTPKAGSYFNTLCEREAMGELGEEWQQFVGTSYDNKALPEGEIDKMVTELGNNPFVIAQEVGAELLQGGAGKAFAEWRHELHVVKQDVPGSNDWTWFAGMDWGYRAPGAVILVAENPTADRLIVRHEIVFKETPPQEVGQRVGRFLLRMPRIAWIAYDAAMDAVTDGGPTVTEEFRKGLEGIMRHMAPALIPAPKGPGSRVARATLLHGALAWHAGPDGQVQEWMKPRMTFHPDCHETIRTISTLNADPKKPEDVDTKGEDHQFDALTYGLMVGRPTPPEEHPDVSGNRHPGFDEFGRRKRPDRDWADREESTYTGVGYELPPPLTP